jgi:hypothetical protein
MSDLLNAAHLAADEAEPAPADDLPPNEFTLTNAVERLRRIAYHQGRIRDIDAQLFDLVEPLRMELERLTTWAEDAQKTPEASIAHHESWLRRYYELNPPTKGLAVKLPNGTLQQPKPKPKWKYPDDERAFAKWLAQYRGDLTKTETVTTFDKVLLKQTVGEHIIDGVPHIDVGDGELVPLEGTRVEFEPAKFVVKTTTTKER